MATALTVDIVTPERSVFSGAASEVLLPAWEGQLGVLPDHDALLSLLRCGPCEVKVQGATHRWVIGRGFADVGGDHVTLLTDQAVAVEAIDKSAAQQDLANALRDAESHPVGTEAHKQAVGRVEWAQALVDA